MAIKAKSNPEPKGMASGIAVWDSFDEIAKRDSLKAHPRNPNKHSAEQLRVYLKIIQGNGWRRSVVVSRRSGFIVKGHGAVLAAELGKLAEVPVRYQDYATAEDELKDLLADNELARLAQDKRRGIEHVAVGAAGRRRRYRVAGVLKKLEEPAALQDIDIKAPPKMAWVLIGIPLVQFSKINRFVEQIAKEPEAVVESTVNDSLAT